MLQPRRARRVSKCQSIRRRIATTTTTQLKIKVQKPQTPNIERPTITRYTTAPITNNIRKYGIFLTIFSILLLLPSMARTNYADEPFIVEPTPALRLSKEDLTTVLLLNQHHNDDAAHLGRYVNVRPEVGLLTSTARTFIQEGVTTEYATEVVGTRLDNGRLYAQYLKKSSRVLYDQGHPAPAVVTSWVGETLNTKTLPQSHNDLFDADQPDWQAIDDQQLLLERNNGVFLGNTDYVIGLNDVKKAPQQQQSVVVVAAKAQGHGHPEGSTGEGNKETLLPLNVVISRSGSGPVLAENARQLAAHKVLPIGDLPTYTVKNHFAPSGFSTETNEPQTTNSEDSSAPRSPKHFYQQVMGGLGASKTHVASPPAIPFNRVLATTTYYGFADFTTIVGDSVIVFSPSTAAAHAQLGHVTSIKGEATLGSGNGGNTQVQMVPISITQDLITPTYTAQMPIETTKIGLELAAQEVKIPVNEEAPRPEAKPEPEPATPSLPVMEIEKKEETSSFEAPKETARIVLETSEILLTTSTTEETSQVASSSFSAATPMFSRPSEEEILKIYASLAEQNRKNEAAKSSVVAVAVPEVTESSVEAVTEPMVSSVTKPQELGGATTVFFEDDPFANFVEPSVSIEQEQSTQQVAPVATVTTSTEASTTESSSNSTMGITPETSTESLMTSTEETNTEEPQQTNSESSSTESSETSEETSPNPSTLKPTPTPSSNVTAAPPAVIVREISPDAGAEELEHCIRTSQVFLTQLPKTLTQLDTVQGADSLETIETLLVPSFDIVQTTKHYCIEPTISSSSTRELASATVETTTSEPSTTTEKSVLEAEVETVTESEMEREAHTEAEHVEHNPTSEEEEVAEGNEEGDENEDSDDSDDSGEEIELLYKTLYTTYTYLTTFFHDESTSISSHTEVVTNVITSTIGVNSSSSSNVEDIRPTAVAPSSLATDASKFMVPSELESLIRESEQQDEVTPSSVVSTSALVDDQVVKTYYTTYTYYTTIFVDGETELMSRTEVHTNHVTERIAPSATISADLASISPEENAVLYVEVREREQRLEHGIDYSTMTRQPLASQIQTPDLNAYASVTLVTDVRSSSSNGDKQIINQRHHQHEPIDDQISSESNTDEIIPSATLLLQTSFTTFTYYTTMYSGDATNIISRLETVTNVVTETLQATKTLNVEEATLPITYFTTFTYWTKLAKDGEITTLSREETISNVVTPSRLTGSTQIEEEKQPESSSSSFSSLVEVPIAARIAPVFVPSKIAVTSVLEPTTYYTTYTYYTTSYELDKTIIDSRLETVTNVITPTITLSETASAGSSATPETLKSGEVSEDSSAGVVVPLPPAPPSTVLYDFKKIIDSDGISTLYFTTQVLPTTAADGSPSELVSSTSSLFIDEVKKALLPTSSVAVLVNADGSPVRQYKTGLVRLIEGTRIGNHTTTLYQSKVIGTFIESRYAQIIESTSSFLVDTSASGSPNGLAVSIAPSAASNQPIEATQVVNLNAAAPSAGVLQSSISETGAGEANEATTLAPSEAEAGEHGEQGEDGDGDGEEGEDDGKARLPFASRKRTFTPVIRPFASRNRPQFAPKKKNGAPGSATIITRSDFTPTITATPALKSSGRFSSSRRGGGGAISSAPISSTGFAGGSSSRRFGRPPSKLASGGAAGASSSGGFGGSRSRLSSSARLSPASASARRPGGLLRPSSSGSFRAGFSSAYAGNSRLRIRPSNSALGAQSTEGATTVAPDVDGAEEESSTQEQPNNEEGDEDEENATDSSRRQQNPLLRFRRPLNRPSGFTPAGARPGPGAGSAISSRRNPLVARTKTTTTTSTTTTTTPRPRPRSFQRPTIGNLQGRSRPQSSLFPPRGLFPKQLGTEKEGKKDETPAGEGNAAEAEDDSEYDDDEDEDGDEEGEEDSNRRRRSNGKNTTAASGESPVKSRVRREADTTTQTRSNFRNRFRRPKPAAAENDATETEAPVTPPVTSAPRARTKTARFNSRYTGHHSTAGTTASTSGSSSGRAIRPTRPTSGRAQFTLREKDSSGSGSSSAQKSLTRPKSNFRRPQTAANARRSSSSNTGSSSSTNQRRLKAYSSNSNNNNNERDSNSRSGSSSTRGRSGLNSGSRSHSRTTGRGRNRNDYNNEAALPSFDGTITVTYVVPAEVTIPVVSGKITEYKNVVTAKTSTEVLGPQQFTSYVGANGQTTLALTRTDSSVNYAGATEITHYVLHETPTTTVTFTPTTIRGRKTSFSHIIPSTVYSVESVVSTAQPQISANAPLANILLSQLLLGNIGLPAANPLLGAANPLLAATPLGGAVATPATPVTEYRTHTSTYVTTLFEGMSTVLPVTFQGKKILTTVYDTTAQTITATEFVTDTIVTTPTQMPGAALAAQAPAVNSLLLQQLLLQQQLQPQLDQQPQLPILHSAPPQLLQLADNLQELDTNNIRVSNEHSDDDLPIVEDTQPHKSGGGRKKSRKSGKSHKRNKQAQQQGLEGSSVITLYVSGRRPGEFSTILSTVPLDYDSTLHKRQAYDHDPVMQTVTQSAVQMRLAATVEDDEEDDFYQGDGSEPVPEYLLPAGVLRVSPREIEQNALDSGEQTQSLESIVGDVSRWYAKTISSSGTTPSAEGVWPVSSDSVSPFLG